jgi:hypothetical protein
MLSFDEFQAVNERSRTKNAASEETKASSEEPVKPKSKPKASTPSEPASKFGLGEFLEMHEMQAVVFCLLLMDSFASFAEVGASAYEGADQSQADMHELMLKLIRAFTSFTVFFFALELLALLVAFRFKFIGHIGYIIDTIVVGIQLHFAINGDGGIQWRVLNLFRFWRLLRLFQSMLNVEREAHEGTKRSIENLQYKRQSLESKLKSAQEDLEKEQVGGRNTKTFLLSTSNTTTQYDVTVMFTTWWVIGDIWLVAGGPSVSGGYAADLQG